MSIAKSSLLFASGTMISRVAGLVRDRVVLAAFGSSQIAEGFTVAFRIPNMFREVLAEGALGGAFTKVYSELMAMEPARARRMLWDSFVLMAISGAIFCAVGALLAPWIVGLITASSETRDVLISTATGLTRLLFPFLAFMILGAIAMGALHQKGRFFLTSVSPVPYNVFSILGALVFAGWFESYAPDWVETVFADKAITGLAVGVLLGGLAQSLVQIGGIWQELNQGRRERTGSVLSSDVRRMLALMVPTALAASAGQINTVVNQYFATSAEQGAVVWLYSSFRLLHFPIGVFGIAISSAVLPTLSRALAKTKQVVGVDASREMQNAVEFVLWLMTPCFVFLSVNGLDAVRALYQSGNFSAYDAEQTAVALNAYSFALISYGLARVMSSFYLAMERTRFALKVSLVCVATNAAANYFLVHRFGHEGIAYGYSVTQALSVTLLVLGMRGHGVQLDRPRLLRSLALMAGAALVAGGLMRGLQVGLVSALAGLGTWPVWASSGLVLATNGVACLAVFAAFGFYYLKLTPQAAWKRWTMRRKAD